MKKTTPLRSASRTTSSQNPRPTADASTRGDKMLGRLFLVKRPHPLSILAMRLRWDNNVNPLEFE